MSEVVVTLGNFWAFAADEARLKSPARLLSTKRTSKTGEELLADKGFDPGLTRKLSYRQWLVAALDGNSEFHVARRRAMTPEVHWRGIARSFARSLKQIRKASELTQFLDQAILDRARLSGRLGAQSTKNNRATKLS